VEGVGGGRVRWHFFLVCLGTAYDFTRHGFEFKKNKKGMGECIRKTVTKLRALSMETKYLRCDNAGCI
jgi:hypothetical protein